MTKATNLVALSKENGRGERIRTSDLSVPNRAHYQAVLRPASFAKTVGSCDGRAILAIARTAGQAIQKLARDFQRTRAMANLILDFAGQLPESHFEITGNEDRVVAETS